MTITNWDEAKDRLFFDLMNAEKNAHLLENVPHGLIGKDIAVVYKILLEETDDHLASATVNMDLFYAWGVSPYELHEAANKSAPRLREPVWKSMDEILGLGTKTGLDIRILTTKKMFHGAAVVVYPGLLSAIAKHWSSGFWILPSSIHEVLLYRSSKEDGADLADMVKAINRTEVADGDVLSDYPMYFNAETRTIEIA